MGLYAGAINYPVNIYQFEETDLVLAATDNVPLQHLADRTAFLKAAVGLMDRMSGDVFVNANGTITNAQQGSLINIYANSILNISLANANTFKHGAILPINVFAESGCVVNISPQGGQPFISTNMGNATVLHVHNNEKVFLMAVTSHWLIINKYGNFDSVGEEIKARKIIPGTLAYTGQLVSRDSYPRLTKFVLELIFNQEVVSDATWNAFPDYRGLYSLGDGSSTIRLPDERGMFDRMLDLGRGVDIDRTHNFAGGYEADTFKSHTHQFRTDGDNALDMNMNVNNSAPLGHQNLDSRTQFYTTLPTGATETKPKNIGKYNLVKY